MITLTEHAVTYKLEFMDRSSTVSVKVQTEVNDVVESAYIRISADYGAEWYYKCDNSVAFAEGLGRALEHIQSYRYTCKNEVYGEIERTVKLAAILFGGN